MKRFKRDFAESLILVKTSCQAEISKKLICPNGFVIRPAGNFAFGEVHCQTYAVKCFELEFYLSIGCDLRGSAINGTAPEWSRRGRQRHPEVSV